MTRAEETRLYFDHITRDPNFLDDRALTFAHINFLGATS